MLLDNVKEDLTRLALDIIAALFRNHHNGRAISGSRSAYDRASRDGGASRVPRLCPVPEPFPRSVASRNDRLTVDTGLTMRRAPCHCWEPRERAGVTIVGASRRLRAPPVSLAPSASRSLPFPLSVGDLSLSSLRAPRFVLRHAKFNSSLLI